MSDTRTETGPDGTPAARPVPGPPPGPPSTRVDRWLWAVRLVKTRSDAVQACRGGHVRIDGRPAKAAAAVRAGAVVRVHLPGGTRIVEVVHIIEKRTSAPIAVQCYIDRTPPPPPEQHGSVPRRDRGAGRPTKRDRRRLDRLRRGES